MEEHKFLYVVSTLAPEVHVQLIEAIPFGGQEPTETVLYYGKKLLTSNPEEIKDFLQRCHRRSITLASEYPTKYVHEIYPRMS